MSWLTVAILRIGAIMTIICCLDLIFGRTATLHDWPMVVFVVIAGALWTVSDWIVMVEHAKYN